MLLKIESITWIPIEEKTPNKDGWYLVTLKEPTRFRIEVVDNIELLFYWADTTSPHWFNEIGKTIKDPDVIAWAELPKGYKENDRMDSNKEAKA